MSQFQSEPLLVLPDKESLRKFIEDTNGMPDNMPIDKWRTRADWLISLIDDIVAEGDFPYNLTIINRAEDALGIPRSSNTGGTVLSMLVYNAQQYRRSQQLRQNGYEPLTQEMVDAAFKAKSKIEISGESMIGSDVQAQFKPRMIDGRVYLMKHKARKYAVQIAGQAAKIVK